MSIAVAQQARIPRSNGLRRFFVGLVKLLIFIYLALFVFLAVDQNYLIFVGAHAHDTTTFRVVPRPGCRLIGGSGRNVLGIFEPGLQSNGMPYPNVGERPTLIYFYGNGSTLMYSTEDLDRFRRAGVNVFIPEYPGYGMNSGHASERGCESTARAAYDYLTRDLHIPPSRIVISGWSMGSAVAIDLAFHVESAGLVVISPFTDMAEEASYQYPLYPAWMIRLVLRYPFANDHKIEHVRCPILDIHSRTDEVVPFDMSTRLLRHAKTPVTRIVIARARHNEFFTVNRRRVREQMLDFVERVTSTH